MTKKPLITLPAVLAAVFAVTYAIQRGFVADNPLLLLPALLLAAALCLLRGLHKLIALPVWAAAFAVTLASGTDILALCLVSSALSACFALLSRNRAGAVTTFFIGTGAFALLSLLGFDTPLWAILLFLCSSACLFALANRTGWQVLGASAGTGLAALAAAVLLFFVVVQPLAPPSFQLSLLKQLQSLNTSPKIGVFSKNPVYNDGQTAAQLDADVPASPTLDPQGMPGNGGNGGAAGAQQQPHTATGAKQQGAAGFVRYEADGLPAILLLLLAAIPLAWLCKRISRFLWYRKTRDLPPVQQAVRFYTYFLRGFSLLGLARSPGDTPLEYAQKNSRRLRDFSTNGVTFQTLTDIYLRANYGSQTVTPQEQAAFQNFYRPFFSNCRRYLGLPRYLLCFFRL